MEEPCTLCGEEAKMPVLSFRNKSTGTRNWICIDCQREIAKSYAATSLDPIELYYLRHKNKQELITIKAKE
jgi:hypothetical protein